MTTYHNHGDEIASGWGGFAFSIVMMKIMVMTKTIMINICDVVLENLINYDADNDVDDEQ